MKQSTLDKYFVARRRAAGNKIPAQPCRAKNNLTTIHSDPIEQHDQTFNNSEKPITSVDENDQSINKSDDITVATDENDQSCNNIEISTALVVERDRSHNNNEDIAMLTDENDQNNDSAETSTGLIAERDLNHNNGEDVAMLTNENDQNNDSAETSTGLIAERDLNHNNGEDVAMLTNKNDQNNDSAETSTGLIAERDLNDQNNDSAETSTGLIAERDLNHNNGEDVAMLTNENDQNNDSAETSTGLITERDRNHNNGEGNAVLTDENRQSSGNCEDPEDSFVCEVDLQTVYGVRRLNPDKRPVKRNKGAAGRNNSTNDLKAIELEFLDTTIKRYHPVKHLLNAESQLLLENWESLGEDGKKIVSYLYWRGDGLQRIELIQYGGQTILNSSNPRNVKDLLLQQGFITSAPFIDQGQDIYTYVQLLSLSELKRIWKKLDIKNVQWTNRKLDIGNALKEYKYYVNPQYNTERVTRKLRESLKACYKLSDNARRTFYELNVLIHLGMLGMDCSVDPTMKITNRPRLIIKSNIIAKSYPVPKSMKVDDASILFQTRDEFLTYLQAYEESEKYFSLRLRLKTILLGKKKGKKNEEIINVQNDNDEMKQQDDIDMIKRRLKEIIEQATDSFESLKNEHKLRYTKVCPWLWRFMPENIYLEIIADGVELLKEQKEYRYAVKLLDLLIQQQSFGQHKKGKFYKTKTIILDKHLKDNAELANTIIEAFKADITDDVKNILKPFATKLCGKRNINNDIRRELQAFGSQNSPVIEESFLNSETVTVNMQSEGQAKLRPEHYCIQYYKQEEHFTNGEHFEDRLLSAMFLLLFWDIIYTKPMGYVGLFMSHYQRYPLDMFTEDFFSNRKMKIIDRLTTIKTSSEEEIIQMMREPWDKLPQYDVSVITRGVDWNHVVGVTQCLGGRAIAAICDRMAQNYSSVYWGLPDLILWDVNTKRIKFREVKTTDPLSFKQWEWLIFLKEQGLDAGLCYYTSS